MWSRPRKPQRNPLRLVLQRCVIELKLLQRVAKRLVLGRVGGVESGENEGADFLVSGKRRNCLVGRVEDRIAGASLLHRAHVGDDIAHFTGAQLVRFHLAELIVSDFGDLIHRVARSKSDVRSGANNAVHNAHARDRAAVAIVVGIVDERAKRTVGVANRRRHSLDHRFEQLGDADSLLGAHEQNLVGVDAEEVVDFLLPALWLRARKIDLVEDGNYLQSRLEREEKVRESLRLDSLRSVDDENGTLARGKRARDFIGEVHVARSVDEVQLVRAPVARIVAHADGVELDGDAPLALEVECVEYLRLHLALLKHAGGFDQSVGERGLAVIDVRDNAEIADVVELQILENGGKARNGGIGAKYNGLEAVSLGEKLRRRDVFLTVSPAHCDLQSQSFSLVSQTGGGGGGGGDGNVLGAGSPRSTGAGGGGGGGGGGGAGWNSRGAGSARYTGGGDGGAAMTRGSGVYRGCGSLRWTGSFRCTGGSKRCCGAGS